MWHTLNIQLLPLVYIVLGTLGQPAGVHRQNAAGAYGYSIVPIAANTYTWKYIVSVYSVYYSNQHSLKAAVVLEEAQQMLAESLGIVRLIRLDRLY